MSKGLKQFLPYEDQVRLLQTRGLEIRDPATAAEQLRILNYYRLSAYWYPMREFKDNIAQDTFQPGATFELAVELYQFDVELRHALFRLLTSVELAIRALIGHELGRIHPLVHEFLDQKSLHAARAISENDARSNFEVWFQKFSAAVAKSREDFVTHHRISYGGKLPIWAAVEVMDWGMLSHLYRLSPTTARDSIAKQLELTAPQLESWLRTLNALRNYTAHNARIFNRAFALTPKMSTNTDLKILNEETNRRLFGQATLVQYLIRKLELPEGNLLPETLKSYPHNDIVPFSRIGAPEHWEKHPLWKITHH